jgi:serine protease Do
VVVSALLAAAAHAGPVELPADYNPALSLAPLVRSVAPAVVTIEVEAELPPQLRHLPIALPDHTGEGSGFLVSADGLVLTNFHVVDGANKLTAVLHDGTEVGATVIGGDAATDLALLRLDEKRDYTYVQLGDSDALEVGDWVVAMGDGLGLGPTVTRGIVSGKGRVLGHDVFGHEDYIQTDAAINQGNSGGPLFDLQGRVVGISTAIVQGANTVGFAIPAELVSRVLPELRDNGRVARGYLGVAPQTLDAELREALGTRSESGAVLASVEDGTPAAEAGLRRGDVVTSIDGEPIDDDLDLVRAIGNKAPGARVRVRYERDSKTDELVVVLAERPGPGRPPADEREDDAPGTSALGLGLAPLSAAVAAESGVSEGVLVERVREGSPAAGRLEPGDVILEVNKRPVESPADVAKALSRTSGTAFLLVLRGDSQQFVALPVE